MANDSNAPASIKAARDQHRKDQKISQNPRRRNSKNIKKDIKYWTKWKNSPFRTDEQKKVIQKKIDRLNKLLIRNRQKAAKRYYLGPESFTVEKNVGRTSNQIAKQNIPSFQEGYSPKGEKAYDRAVRKANEALQIKGEAEDLIGEDARRSDPVQAAKDEHGAFSTQAGKAWMAKHFPGVKIEYDFEEYDKYKKGGSIKKGMKKTKKKTKARKRAALRGYRKELRGG